MESTLGDLARDVRELVTGVGGELGTRPEGGLLRGRRKASLGLVLIALALVLTLVRRREAPAAYAQGAARCCAS